MTRVGLSVGIDLVEVARLTAALERWPRLRERVFTRAELETCAASGERLAARFAAKEAAFKALGDGWPRLRYTDVEVESAPDGSPMLRLTGRAAEKLSGRDAAISLAHSAGLAIAEVVVGGAPE